MSKGQETKGEERREKKERRSTFFSSCPSILALLLIFFAFILRIWQLDTTPPGWRDDELINSLVISQKVLDGDWAVYYADASGHEALYHVLNAIMLGLFGPNFLGIRYLSTLLSLLTVALTYQIGRHLFNRTVGLIAVAALTLSFWSLMYGRIGLRHVLTPPLALLAFYFFWQALQGRRGEGEKGGRGELFDYCITPLFHYPISYYLLAGIFTALGLYTYFASRGVPLILLAFCAYLALFAPGSFKQHWRGWAVMFGVTVVLSLPLFLTLQQQPESEGRVAELAVPLIEARAGNFQPLLKYTLTTLAMFHATGDSEWLYNIADRPLFSPVVAIFFWLGVLICLWQTLQALTARHATRITPYSPYTFLLLWWLAGISPAFISVPPASLGHTILAQPATYLLLALPLGINQGAKKQAIGSEKSLPSLRSSTFLLGVLACLLLIMIAWRDLPDYFSEWPQRGLVRFLYRADYADIADYLNEHDELTEFGVTSLLAGPWDKVALKIDTHTAAHPRWYNPEKVLLVQPPLSFYGFPKSNSTFAPDYLPHKVRLGDYQLATIQTILDKRESVCFQNGLCALGADYTPNTEQLKLIWQLQRPLNLPPTPLISNPPPPGVYAGPRLSVFTHLLNGDSQFLIGNDGLWIDPTTLYEGDIFIQLHDLPIPAVGQTIVFGLYDPLTGERILTEDGRDAIAVDIGR